MGEADPLARLAVRLLIYDNLNEKPKWSGTGAVELVDRPSGQTHVRPKSWQIVQHSSYIQALG